MRTSTRSGLYNETVERIGLDVVSGAYGPGERLATLEDFAEELGVSRTVMREAIRLLIDKGLIKSRPRVGTTVAEPSDWKLGDADVLHWIMSARPGDMLTHVAEVRLVVEPAAAGLAARRRQPDHLAALDSSFRRMCDAADDYEAYIVADLEFHNTILRAAANPILTQMLATVRTALEGVRRLTVTVAEGPTSTLEMHDRVRLAIRDRQQELATDAMRELISISTEHLCRVLLEPES